MRTRREAGASSAAAAKKAIGGPRLRGRKWWAREDSNLRPTGYEPAALPLSYEPTLVMITPRAAISTVDALHVTDCRRLASIH